VIFGITGDLAKVMTFHSLYRLEARKLLKCLIIGVAVDGWSHDDLVAHAREAIENTGEPIDDEIFARLTGRMSYLAGDFGDAHTYQRVGKAVGDAATPVFYLEIPPFLFGPVIKGLSDAKLVRGGRVVVEKPFGHDQDSARELMQLLSAGTMEAPAGRDPDTMKNAQVALWKAVLEADPAHYVRGQYDGYRQIPGVAAGSTTETYAALRLEIDNWRWSGVPFFIRTGKRMPTTQTEFRAVFKRPPRLGLGLPEDRRPEQNQIVIKLDPSTGIRFELDARRADAEGPEAVDLAVNFAEQGGEGATPYEMLLHAAMVGQSSRFTRQDGVEEEWRIMQPLLDSPPEVHPYEPGTWGPAAADRLLAGYGAWQQPWISK
jgi:glucose-6-phosphate 1-dehydrogenase